MTKPSDDSPSLLGVIGAMALIPASVVLLVAAAPIICIGLAAEAVRDIVTSDSAIAPDYDDHTLPRGVGSA